MLVAPKVRLVNQELGILEVHGLSVQHVVMDVAAIVHAEAAGWHAPLGVQGIEDRLWRLCIGHSVEADAAVADRAPVEHAAGDELARDVLRLAARPCCVEGVLVGCVLAQRAVNICAAMMAWLPGGPHALEAACLKEGLLTRPDCWGTAV